MFLVAFAMTIYHADAQSRRTTQPAKSESASRPASSSRKSPATSPTRSTRKSPSTTPSSSSRPSYTRPSSSRPSGVSRPSDNNKERQPSTTVRKPSSSVSRPSSSAKSVGTTKRPTANTARPVSPVPGNHKKPVIVPPSKPVQIRPDHKPDKHHIHPRERDFLHFNKPAYFWSTHNHYYGHKVRVLPTTVVRINRYGITYYCHNDIWYRPYGAHYIVCRPPVGTALAVELISDMVWTAVRLSYFNTAVQTYNAILRNDDQIAEQNRIIMEQNALIAQNNAVIAQQNSQIASSQAAAQAAYSLANELGLVQSYAAAGSEYFYQDGVFYMKDATGEYRVIIPPAGALVESLPEDYDLVVINDNEYYKVDDTVYKLSISEGKPYFEVLGQQY